MVKKLSRSKPEVSRGWQSDLGATVTRDGTNFAIFSGRAERVELCLFDRSGSTETARIELPELTDEIWHGFVPGIGDGQLYGYRVHGPRAPEEGLRFNANKLLLDPYARQLSGEFCWDDALYDYDVNAQENKDLSLSESDSAQFMPKCVVTGPLKDGRALRPSMTSFDRSIIYETHMRGFTMMKQEVPTNLRGSCDGFAHKSVVGYIKGLGVTAVELLPVHAFVDDRHLVAKGMRNHWGYNSISFFAPQLRYLGKGGLVSFRNMVRKYHDVGLEVILDVVYNHTAEGNEFGPMLSFKGIDNIAYYRQAPGSFRHYMNHTGTGNTINTSHPRVLQMVMDSLRYWVEVMEVDGFRFDLGTTLGREPSGFDQRSGFFDAVGQDPVLRRVKLIAEPWDIGPGGYQVGGFPPGWAEWNDKYRDTVKSYWKADHGTTRDLAARITGSGDVYAMRGRRPWASINFLTAHDGFTLNDVVSYNEKHNATNGEDNRDGHGDNRSYNYGVEGRTDDVNIIAVRERQKRNFLATLMFSHGTPMLLAGDEFGRTQEGNNNVYCQDNRIGWTEWAKIGPLDQALTEFTRSILRLRSEHEIFRRPSFRDGCVIRWLNPSGGDQTEERWNDAGALTFGLLLANPRVEGAKEALILLNPFDGDVAFEIPAPATGTGWSCLVDTANAEKPCSVVPFAASSRKIPLRSLVVLAATGG